MLQLKRIITCARCGEDHTDLVAKPFTRTFALGGDTWTHWVMCPRIGEPILITTLARPASVLDEMMASLEAKPDAVQPVEFSQEMVDALLESDD